MDPFEGWVRPYPQVQAVGADHAAPGLTVMSYNIRHGRGMDGEIDLPRLARVIADSKAAVVGLNEVDIQTERSSNVDQPGTLGDLLAMHVIYGPNIEYQGGLYGNAMLSRYPVMAATNMPLPAGGRRRWGLLHAQLDVNGTVVHYLTTHLSLVAAERLDQLQQILNVVVGLRGPVILMGDLNIVAGTDEDPSGVLGPVLTDAYVAALSLDVDEHAGGEVSAMGGQHRASGVEQRGRDLGFTFPSDNPLRRIDYIFINELLSVAGPDAVYTIDTQASDHLPLVARLCLRV